MSRALISLQRLYEKVQCMLPAFFLVWHHDVRTRGVPGDQPILCIGATFTTAKVVRPRSDRGSRCTNGKD